MISGPGSQAFTNCNLNFYLFGSSFKKTQVSMKYYFFTIVSHYGKEDFSLQCLWYLSNDLCNYVSFLLNILVWFLTKLNEEL